MYKNYLVIALRRLIKNKFFSLINIIGLALGIASSFLLLQYASFELSYDKFHEKVDNIYRIQLDTYENGAFESSSAILYHGAGPSIKESIPNVLNFVRLHRADGLINYNDQNNVVSHYEQKAYYVDSTFFSIFDFEIIKGNKNNILQSPNAVVISESTAYKYFANSDPVGKVINLHTEWEGGEYIVNGVFKDVPENSHLKFDFLFSIENLLSNQQFKYGGWYWTNFYTYLELSPDTELKEVEKSFSNILEKHRGNELRNSNREEKLILQPLKDIHLKSSIFSELEINGNYKLVNYTLIISFIIIVIAWLNYINLSTAKAMERGKEVGIRKVLGSDNKQLIKQFLLESFILILISFLLAVIFVLFGKLFFSQLIGRNIALDIIGQINFWMIAIGILIVGTLLAGFYPAVVLASFQPIEALKGRFKKSFNTEQIRKALVVLQFFASFLLIMSTITINKQIKFLQNQELGINIEGKVIVRAPKRDNANKSNNIENFKNELVSNSAITNVTFSSEVPGKEIFWTNEFVKNGELEENKKVMSIIAVDEDFIPGYNISLIEGRNFSEKHVSDYGNTVIVNETALSQLGFENPENAINQVILHPNPKKIVGVIKDFHQESLKKSNTPLVLLFKPWGNEYITITLGNSGNLRENIDYILKSFNYIFPENSFEFFFLDEYFNKQYQSEEQFWKIVTLFTFLAIFIACIGLLGLSSFMLSRKTKEVGIRKVLGGNTLTIVVMLLKGFVKLIVIAFLLATPVAWFVMNRWLEDFAYRMDIPVSVFLISGILVLFIAVSSIILQALRAAFTNPIVSLREE